MKTSLSQLLSIMMKMSDCNNELCEIFINLNIFSLFGHGLSFGPLLNGTKTRYKHQSNDLLVPYHPYFFFRLLQCRGIDLLAFSTNTIIILNSKQYLTSSTSKMLQRPYSIVKDVSFKNFYCLPYFIISK